MIVLCPSCDKKYKLDDTKIHDDGVKVKCTKCETVFVVKPQASARQFRVRLTDGEELGSLALTELILKIQTGQIGPDDLVAGQGEPFSPAADHPDLEGVKFKKAPAKVVPDEKENTEDDDLFGDTSEEDDLFSSEDASDDDDLFGGSDNDDDLFGSGEAANEDDDLFDDGINGQDEPTASDDDLFGSDDDASESSGETDDDLFADNDAADSDPFASHDDEDMFGTEDNASASNDDDLFGDEGDDDLFGEDENTSQPEESASELFGDSSDENLFGDDEEEEEAAGSALFDDDESDNSGLFDDAGENTGDDYSYEEDIQDKIADNPLENDSPAPDLFGDDFQVEEGIEDLITAPLDLPEMKRSYTSLILGLVIFLIFSGSAAAIFFVPGSFKNIPLLGRGILVLHRSLGTSWYLQQEGSRVLRELNDLAEGYNIAELETAYKICADNEEIVRHNKDVEELCARYLLITILSQTRSVHDFVRKYGVLEGLPGAIIHNLDARNKIPSGPSEWLGLLHMFARTQGNEVDKVRQQLHNTQFPEPVRFAANLLSASIAIDLGDKMEALASLESAADAEPLNRFVVYQMAFRLVTQKHFTEAKALLNDLSDKQAHPWLASRLLSLRATIDEREEDFQAALEKAGLAIKLDADNLHAVALKANLLNRTGNAIDTLLLLQNYITRFPRNYDLRLQEGIAKEMLGRVKEALAVYKETAELSEIRLEAPLRRAALLARTGVLDDAFAIIEELRIRFPENPDVLLGLGQLELEKGDLDKAQSLLQKVLDKTPSSPAGLLAMGRLRMARNEITKAEKLFAKAKSLDPLHLTGRLELGEVYLRRKKLDKAEEVFSEILESRPQNSHVLLALGKIAYLRKKYKDAEDFLNEALKHQSAMHEGYMYLALANRDSGQYDEAILNLKRALAIKDVPQYKLVMAETYSRANKPGTALAVYDELLEQNPDNLDALWASVRLYMQTGDDTHALARLNHIRTIRANDPRVDQFLATIYLRQNRLADAAKSVAKGLRKNKKNVTLLRTAAQIFLARSEYAKAYGYLKKARSLAPRDGLTHFYLGYYYKEAKNQLDKAQIEFERAMKFGLPEETKAIAQGELDALRYR